MKNISWKNIALGIISVVGIFIILMAILGARFRWSSYDLYEGQPVAFVSTCSYTGIWYEKWHFQIVFFESCMNI